MIYRRIPRLFPELTLAHGDGTYPTVLARFARVDVLILDDWGLVGLKDAQRQDLLEILDDRDGNRSTDHHEPAARPIAGTNTWAIPPLADAILDRVVHRAHRLTLTGPSRRKANGNGSSAPNGKSDAERPATHPRGCSQVGRPSRSSLTGPPVRSRWSRGSLWTVPELWKTHRTRFPQLLGRRTERAAHNGPQASSFVFLKKEEQNRLQ